MAARVPCSASVEFTRAQREPEGVRVGHLEPDPDTGSASRIAQRRRNQSNLRRLTVRLSKSRRLDDLRERAKRGAPDRCHDDEHTDESRVSHLSIVGRRSVRLQPDDRPALLV